MNGKQNNPYNRLKFVLHGFFFQAGISVAEPSTILPLMVSFFSSSSVLVGLYSSLLRGGAVLMQLYAAFHAQTYQRVMRAMKNILFFRFVSWFGIGVAIYFFGEKHPVLTLWLIGAGLFIFSFTAGFGVVYFQELLGKCFTHDYRGVTIGYRQAMMGLGGILGGLLVSVILRKYPSPGSFAYAYILGALVIGTGYILFITIHEYPKKNTSKRERKFMHFLHNAFYLLGKDKKLGLQTTSRLFSYTYLFALPFIVLQHKSEMNLGGLALGSTVPLLAGTLVSNFVWGRLSGRNRNKLIILISYFLMICSLVMSLFSSGVLMLAVLFFLAGSAADGFKLSYANLVLIIAPEDKRPVYIAIQNNLTSFGLFFSIPGGLILRLTGFEILIYITLLLMVSGMFISMKLKS